MCLSCMNFSANGKTECGALFISKSGRAKLAFNRTMIITASAFIITGVLFFTTFLTSFILYKNGVN